MYEYAPCNTIYVEPGVDYHPYMMAAKSGLEYEGGPRIAPEGLVQDPDIAHTVANAMKPHYEAGMWYEAAAVRDEEARRLGKYTLTIVDGEHKGMIVGPFLTDTERQQHLLFAASAYREAHATAAVAWIREENAAA